MNTPLYTATSLRSFISRRVQIAFVVGLVLGIVLGWLFSGVVSAIMRFGLLVVLLVPLMIALWFWWRVRNAPRSPEPTVFTWTSLDINRNDPFGTGGERQQPPADVIIDLDDLDRTKRP